MVEASQTVQMVLSFDDFEDADGFVPPDRAQILLRYATAADADKAAKDQFESSSRYWTSPKPDFSLPQTQVQRQEVVRILLAAMKDPTKAIDKDKDTFEKRWAADAKEKYDEVLMEATCWKIAVRVIIMTNRY